MRAYYNEHDPNAAAWLRELIKDGLITDGEVDERSIEDVLPADLNGFDRCHFFAGIGVWDYALNLSGFTGKVWTGSCPCQPFSAAGKGEGFADERHLWPAWFHLIDICRPNTIFGEQVASKDGLTWLDLVSADVEGIDYSIAAIDIPVAGVGAPHIRQRLFWVADTTSDGHLAADGLRAAIKPSVTIRTRGIRKPAGSGHARRLAHSASRNASAEGIQRSGEHGLLAEGRGTSRMVNAELRRSEQRDERERSIQEFDAGCSDGGMENSELSQGPRFGQHGGEVLHDEEPNGSSGASATNGFWNSTEWVYCNDPKSPRWRPTKPGVFPLADRTPGRVALLRGAGNAISPWVAKAFIESYLEL